EEVHLPQAEQRRDPGDDDARLIEDVGDLGLEILLLGLTALCHLIALVHSSGATQALRRARRITPRGCGGGGGRGGSAAPRRLARAGGPRPDRWRRPASGRGRGALAARVGERRRSSTRAPPRGARRAPTRGP